jgi:hypothetical protein
MPEERFPHIVLRERGNIRFLGHLRRGLLEGQVEHALQCGRLAVDSSVRYRFRLTVADIGPYLVVGDVDGTHTLEGPLEVPDATCGLIEWAFAINGDTHGLRI